ncbi:hypothetical protein [Streptomyces purpurascens]|uniref:hypothetical protein n=1 Tax=Streptomyces purpurascens TaxID=1924 RepID=UPI0016749E38|nr:hypothetical protein [Streptomyces purpurascens]MCE7049551.1 hypothetical protein [Streptomyces purpurascens]GHA22514.1 hypothetical protein GCM10010303_36290 [Streptomyces purpurascens]
MAMRVEVPASAINTEFELPITIGVGEVVSTVGSITLAVRDGQVEDFRPVLADALREAADAVERADLDEDEQEVDGAAP